MIRAQATNRQKNSRNPLQAPAENLGLNLSINPVRSICVKRGGKIYDLFGILVCIWNIPFGYTAFVSFGVSTLNSTKGHTTYYTLGTFCGQVKYTMGVAHEFQARYLCR